MPGRGTTPRHSRQNFTLSVILPAGMTFVILIGGIDLSVGSVMALAAATTTFT